MPFYIRARQQDIPTPTISSVGSDDEDNFITDPEKFFDELPQPFRLINKIVTEIFESSWENISARELELELEAKRVRPPIYTPTAVLDKFPSVSCFCQTDDDNLMFLGLEGSLVAYQTDTLNEISSWSPEDEICIDEISSCYYAVGDIHLLSIIDDMGFARLLIFENETFHLVSVLNELVEGAPKSNATKFIIAPDSQHCSVSLQSNQTDWVEIYKLPLENWSKEIDAGRKEFLKKTESLIAASASDGSVDLEVTQFATSELSFPEIKFSLITLGLKVNQPASITGSSARTAQQMLEQVTTGDVIGDGSCHGVTESSLYIQKKMFEILNERDIIHAEEESVPIALRPSVYFLKKSCIEPVSQLKSDSIFTHIGIWWSHHHNFYIYQLDKLGKTVEFKPDAVWPQSSSITCCSMANESMLLAIGVENGSLTIWDRQFGLVKCVVSVCNNIPLTHVSILNVPPTNTGNAPDNINLLVGCANGQVSFVSTCKQKPKIVVSASFDKFFTLLRPIPKLPQVFFMVCNDGNMMLRKTEEDNILCSLSLSEDYQYEIPFESGCMIDSNGEILYIRGSSLSSSIGGNIFMYHLRNFPTLDKIRVALKNEHDETPAKFDDVVQSLLSKRLQAQASRTASLQSRWHNLHKQLEIVLNLKEMLLNKKHAHPPQSSTPASHWSRATTNIIAHKKDLKA